MRSHLRDLYGNGRFGLSFEVFPPKTEAGERALWQTLEALAAFRPGFVSCTYGAGGGTRGRTIAICRRIQDEFQLTATAHRTCVDATREELIEWLEQARAAGIGNIMALRGDRPKDQPDWQPVEGGLRYANELVELIHEHFPEMGVGVAGYPETHREAPDPQTDLENLKRKVDAGAHAVFTQLFYENASFFDFRDRCEKIGIEVPIVPGIMPITHYDRIRRISELCGAHIPATLIERLESAREDKQAQFEIGVEYAIEQCSGLIRAGVPGIHFYVLNRAQACQRILQALGFSTREAAECA